MNQNFLTRVELVFWNFAIRLLSHSSRTRTILRGAIQLSAHSELTALCFWTIMFGLTGLLSGYLLYFLVSPAR